MIQPFKCRRARNPGRGEARTSRVAGARAAQPAAPTGKRGWRLRAGAAAGLVILLGGAFSALRTRPGPPPLFQQLTFRRGALWNARFSSDGRTIVYAAPWAGGPSQLDSTRLPAPSPRPHGVPAPNLLPISDAGQLAVTLA